MTEIMSSADLTDMYKDILSYKYQPNFKPQWLLERRKCFTVSKITEFRICAIICEPTVSSLMPKRELYDSSKGAWTALDRVNSVVVPPIYAIAQWQNSYFISGGQGSIVHFDVSLMENTNPLRTPVRCEQPALMVHSDCLYVLAGNEYNSKNYTYDKPTNLVQK